MKALSLALLFIVGLLAEPARADAHAFELGVVFREKPILDVLQPETDFNRKERPTTQFVGGTEVASGALFFKPDVNLHLDKGATIVGVDELVY